MNRPYKKMKSVSQVGEISLIKILSKVLSVSDPEVLCGIGDDAAVLKLKKQKLLFTTDSLQENIHFDWRYTSPYLLGRKSLSVNLSDIAAMGGKPRWALVSLALPSKTSLQIVKDFYRGLQSSAREFGVEIVGGDTDQSKQGWRITLALIGEAKEVVYRKGARIGDQIWVTGCLGASALGLKILQKHVGALLAAPQFHDSGRSKQRPYGRVEKYFIHSHQNPTPRIHEGQALAKGLATAMMDISDGLLLDLERLCEASKVGAKIHANLLPLAKGHLELGQKIKKDPLRLALGGGEDYELLFTASPKSEEKIRTLFKKLKTPVTKIGEIFPKKNKILVMNEKGQSLKIHQKGFQHFP